MLASWNDAKCFVKVKLYNLKLYYIVLEKVWHNWNEDMLEWTKPTVSLEVQFCLIVHLCSFHPQTFYNGCALLLYAITGFGFDQ